MAQGLINMKTENIKPYFVIFKSCSSFLKIFNKEKKTRKKKRATIKSIMLLFFLNGVKGARTAEVFFFSRKRGED